MKEREEAFHLSDDAMRFLAAKAKEWLRTVTVRPADGGPWAAAAAKLLANA